MMDKPQKHHYVLNDFVFLSKVALLLYSAQLIQAVPLPQDLEVIIDTDPGADDAMAILLMLSNQSPANVLAITTVTGNTGVMNATKNALLILEVANRLDIPVYAGSDQGLVYNKEPDPYFGYDGLGDIFTYKPSLNLAKKSHAALAMANIVKEKPGRVTILCIGPLTNLALALHINPRLLEDARDVVILGGSYQGAGSIKPGVEFNTYSDPEAAAFVFSKVPVGKTVTVVPVETTRAVKTTLDWRINTLGKIDSCYMEFMNRAERISLSKARHWSLSDQVTALVVVNPSIVKSTKNAYIIVETCGETARGAFFRDDRNNSTNVNLITEVDKSAIKNLLLNYMSNSSKCKNT